MSEDATMPPRAAPDEVSVRDQLSLVVSRLLLWFESFIAGGAAGAIAKSIIAPGDRVKIIFQADANRAFSLSAAFKVAQKIVEAGGVPALWTGHGATLLRIVPYAAISYSSFDVYNRRAYGALGLPYATETARHGYNTSSRKHFLASFVAGSAAGATATAATYPFDLMRARFAAHWDVNKRYPSYISAFRAIVAEEGPRALYGGMCPTIIGIVPYAGISFACFETFKSLAARGHRSDTEPLRPHERWACGALAGLIAQSTTYPLDIVRRRMQVHPFRYPTMAVTFRTVVREEGMRAGLFKGLTMNWIKGPIAVGASFTANDYFKARMRAYHGVYTGAHVLTDDPQKLNVAERVFAGGVAGAVAKLWTIPFDRLKITYAVGRHMRDGNPASSVNTMRMLIGDSKHMWQGAGAMMLRVVPYAAITYTAFTLYLPTAQRLVYAATPQDPACVFAAGALAATTATVVTYPMDVLHARTAADGLRSHSYARELRGMWGQGRSALFSGLRPALMGTAPLTGVAFAAYHEGCRRLDATTFAQQMLVGAAAGFAAQALTYPLHVVRRTAQVEEAVERSVLKSLANIYTNRGLFTGLYRRLPIGWVLGPTTVGLSFALNDAMGRSLLRARPYTARINEAVAFGDGF